VVPFIGGWFILVCSQMAKKIFKIGLAVLIQYRRVTSSHSASQPSNHVAVASTAYYVARVKMVFLIKVVITRVSTLSKMAEG